MGVKHNKGDFVWLKIGRRPPLKIMILDTAGCGMYFLDWGSCGFNPLLNTVRISGNSLRKKP